MIPILLIAAGCYAVKKGTTMRRFCIRCLAVRLQRNRQYAMCDQCAHAIQLFLAIHHHFTASGEAERFVREAAGE